MAGTPKPIGKILLIAKGDYNPTAIYYSLDWVRHQGKTWVCKADNTQGVEPVEGATWTLLAEDGKEGNSIESISKTSTDPTSLVDTYTITYTDGSTSTFTVTNGRGISSILKTGTDPSGIVDTYTITYTDGTTSEFTVTNGKSGSGTGDMLKADYSTKYAGVVDKAVALYDGTNEILAGELLDKTTYASNGLAGTVDKATVLVDTVNSVEADSEVLAKFSDDGDGLKYDGEPVGSVIDVDDALSETSENPVQNKVITSKLNYLDDVALFGMVEYGHWYDGGAKEPTHFRGKMEYSVKGRVIVENNTEHAIYFMDKSTFELVESCSINATTEFILDRECVWYYEPSTTTPLTEADIKTYLSKIKINVETGTINNVLSNTNLDKNIIGKDWTYGLGYTVGNYVLYNNSLYKCVGEGGDVTIPGTNPLIWEETKTNRELSILHNAITPKIYYSDALTLLTDNLRIEPTATKLVIVNGIKIVNILFFATATFVPLQTNIPKIVKLPAEFISNRNVVVDIFCPQAYQGKLSGFIDAYGELVTFTGSTVPIAEGDNVIVSTTYM